MPRNRSGRVALVAACCALVVAAVLAFTGSVSAFAPTNTLAFLGGGTSHQRMTDQALRALDAEFFGITDLTKSMKKALEQIEDANIQVDDDQFLSAHHFDGENFAGGQAFIVAGNRPLIIRTLEHDNAGGARFYLGQALHTIQDFYAHSNWIELGNSSPNPEVGVPGATIVGAPMSAATCIPCSEALPFPVCPDCTGNLTTGQLTSGYYGREDRIKPSASKCSHGGLKDESATGRYGHGINKDVLDCSFSPHHALHTAAVAVAREATEKFVRELRDDITPRQLKLLLGVGPTLAMAIDTTGSMGSVIASVKSVAINLVNSRLGTDQEPSKYVLAPFNDPFVGPTTVTSDADTFKARINGLFASGGGDCPELAMTGMLQALGASDEGGVLFMFTDASAKDSAKAGAVASLAVDKDIKVYIMTFGSCSPIDPGFIRIAQESGGQLFELFRSEAGRVTQLADFLVRSNAVDVLSVAAPLAGTASVSVPVDSTMTSVTFSISGTPSVTLKRPDGSTVGTADPGVSFIGLSHGAIYSIADPTEGAWTVELLGSGQYSLNVSGESDLNLDSFRFVELRGRPGHEGHFAIPGLPVAGQPNTVVAVMAGDFADVAFELRSKDGTLLEGVALDHGPGQLANEFMGEVVPPAGAFLVYARGLDGNGVPYSRVIPGSVAAQQVRVDRPRAKVLPVDQTTNYQFTVTNFGDPDTFSFSASDDQRYLSAVSPTLFALGSGESLVVSVDLHVPASAEEGTLDTLTVNVENLAKTTHNFAVVNSTVVTEAADTTPPVIASVTADPEVLWPPNHKMHEVTIDIEVSDDQDPAPVCVVAGVTSDEPINGPGDGNTDPDWEVPDPDEPIVMLRAERAGDGDARVYTVNVECSDATGNSSAASVDVTVPHNQ